MSRRLSILLFTLLFFLYSNAQDNQIMSLHELSTFVFKHNVDEIEKAISIYNFTFEGATTLKLNSGVFDEYKFKKESAGVQEEISFYKEKEPTNPMKITYRIVYSSMGGNNYNNYKTDLLKDKSNKFINENITGDCFHRNYKNPSFDYDFCICKTQYPNDPMYMIMIDFDLTNSVPE